MIEELRQFVQGVLLVLGALIPIVNPLGGAPVFLAMTAGNDNTTRNLLARKVAINSLILLLVSVFIGGFVLEFFGISVPVVQVAGGLLVSSMGWQLLTHGSAQPEPAADTSGADDTVGADAVSTRAFYPLTLPLTVGPGTISVAITIGANHRTSITSYLIASIASIVGAVIVCATVYACYRNSRRLGELLGKSGTAVVIRLTAFILVCIGVQIVWNGVAALLGSMGAPVVKKF
jgi:multiple antibiotic resistance protein